jgi:DNA-binding CsgD family transcriptional regulator
LTDREAEVLFWVAQGKTSPEIGVILTAATTTIKKHVQNILSKMGVENRLAAALVAKELLSSHGAGLDD